MKPDEIVNHPIHIEESLQTLRRFGVGIGLATKSGTFSSQGTKEDFGMVDVNLFLFYGLFRFGMLVPRSLILGTFGAFLVGLRSLVGVPQSLERKVASETSLGGVSSHVSKYSKATP